MSDDEDRAETAAVYVQGVIVVACIVACVVLSINGKPEQAGTFGLIALLLGMRFFL